MPTDNTYLLRKIHTADFASAALPPSDNLYTSQWYLPELRIPGIWPDYTGAGVKIAIIDDGFDQNHIDLTGQFADVSHDYVDNDSNPSPATGDNHGTAVAGIIGALNNATGTVGIAYDATLIGLRVSFGANAPISMFDDALGNAKNFDIVNNSWGYISAFTDDFANAGFAGFRNGIRDAAMLGRHGLGTVIVFAGGNSGASGDNTNYHNLQNTPYAITVAAIGTDGNTAPFSTPGASILVSAPGQAIVTTDVSGSAGYVPGDYVTHSGTSFAAPMVSGIVALMLEANPDLGYRDVQEILAYAARKAGADTSWQTNGAANWNGGGLHVSPSYGFGIADAHAAVRLAETWTTSHDMDNLLSASAMSTHAPRIITDNGTTTSTITIANDIVIDHAQVKVDITHANASQLQIILISPDGTRSVLADHAPYNSEFPTFTFDTVADWGEHSLGTWTLQVSDTVTGVTGTLNSWTLILQGDAPTPDDVYIYTDENIGGFTPADTNGGLDTINASAMTRAVSIDLASTPVIENLYTGDANDSLRGNQLANLIDAGRGNDVIAASGGNDTINGGAGIDTYTSFDVFNHALTQNGANDITLTSLTDGTAIRLQNVENYNFAGHVYDMAGLINAAHSGTLTDVIYFVHGTAGIAQKHSTANGSNAFTAQDLNIGGDGVVLLSDREFDHLTLTNNAGGNLNAITMRMDLGLNLTVRGFNQVDLVADGEHATSIDVAGGQRGFVQTGGGNDTVNFLAFLIDQNAPAQNRTLTAHTNAGNDTVTVTDRSAYLVYDIDLGAGDDHFTAKGTQGGHILGGTGADIFEFGHNSGDATGIYDFSVGDGDRLDLSILLETHNPNDGIASFIEFATGNGNTTVNVDHHAVVTLYGTTLSDSVQHYIDIGTILTDNG